MLAAIYYLCATVYILLGFASSSSPLQYTLGLASLIVTTTIALEIPTSSGSIFDQSILRGPILQMAKPYLVDVNAYLGGVSCIIAGSMGAGEYFDMGPWVPAIPPLCELRRHIHVGSNEVDSSSDVWDGLARSARTATHRRQRTAKPDL